MEMRYELYGHPNMVNTIQVLCAAYNNAYIRDCHPSEVFRIFGTDTEAYKELSTLSYSYQQCVVTPEYHLFLTLEGALWDLREFGKLVHVLTGLAVLMNDNLVAEYDAKRAYHAWWKYTESNPISVEIKWRSPRLYSAAPRVESLSLKSNGVAITVAADWHKVHSNPLLREHGYTDEFITLNHSDCDCAELLADDFMLKNISALTDIHLKDEYGVECFEYRLESITVTSIRTGQSVTVDPAVINKFGVKTGRARKCDPKKVEKFGEELRKGSWALATGTGVFTLYTVNDKKVTYVTLKDDFEIKDCDFMTFSDTYNHLPYYPALIDSVAIILQGGTISDRCVENAATALQHFGYYSQVKVALDALLKEVQDLRR